MSLRIDADRFRDWARLCADSLAAARAEIDALNVFPVPDSDTGTNAYLTFAAGLDAITQEPIPTKVPEVLKRYGEGLLMEAACEYFARKSGSRAPMSWRLSRPHRKPPMPP